MPTAGATVVLAGAGGLGGKVLDRLCAERLFRGKPIACLIVIDFMPTAEKRAAVGRRLASTFERSAALHWDAASFESTKALVSGIAAAVQHGGGVVDGLLITTGMGFHGRVQDTDLERLNQVFQRLNQINAVGPALLSHIVATNFMAPELLNAGAPAPVVLFISSYSGIVGLPERAAYCASKAALNGWAEGLYADMRHLRVVLVCPVSVDTGFRDNWRKALGSGPASPAAPTAPQQSSSSGGDSGGLLSLVFRSRTKLTVDECVADIMTAFNDTSRGTGVQYIILKGFWLGVSSWLSRAPVLGDFVRERVLAKAANSHL